MLKQIARICLPAIAFLLQACSGIMPVSTVTPTQTIVPPTPATATPTVEPVTATATLIPIFGQMPADATGIDTVLSQYTKQDINGETLDYSPELGMWMELHSPPNGIYLIDQRIAFYKTSHDLLPMIVEADPALGWTENLLHVDQSSIYWTDRLRLVSFSSIVEIELAMQSGIDLQQRDANYYVTSLLDNIYRGTKSIQFRVPGDPSEYTWILKKGIRVWLVKDGSLDQKTDASIYLLNNGDKLKIFEEEGVLEYIISTTSLDQELQHDGILTKILSPMFEVLLSANEQLPAKINSFYDPNHTGRSPGDLSDLAGPTTVGDISVPGFILLVRR